MAPRKFNVGQRILVHMSPHPGHATDSFLPGRVTKYMGKMDLYDGRVPQKRVDFPVVQHHYEIELEEGGQVFNSESRIIPDPRYKNNFL